jgi:hypothetical protein
VERKKKIMQRRRDVEEAQRRLGTGKRDWEERIGEIGRAQRGIAVPRGLGAVSEEKVQNFKVQGSKA